MLFDDDKDTKISHMDMKNQLIMFARKSWTRIFVTWWRVHQSECKETVKLGRNDSKIAETILRYSLLDDETYLSHGTFTPPRCSTEWEKVSLKRRPQESQLHDSHLTGIRLGFICTVGWISWYIVDHRRCRCLSVDYKSGRKSLSHKDALHFQMYIRAHESLSFSLPLIYIHFKCSFLIICIHLINKFKCSQHSSCGNHSFVCIDIIRAKSILSCSELFFLQPSD